MYKILITAIFFLLIVSIYGCTNNDNSGVSEIKENLVSGNAIIEPDQKGEVGLKIGNIAPDFNIKTIDGKNINFREYTKDKPAVLYFFATWCPHCRNDLTEVNKVYDQYESQINFLAVGLDPKEGKGTIEKYRERLGLINTNFATAKRDILSKYNVVYTTTKYLIGKNGVILGKSVGELNADGWEAAFKDLI